MSDKIKYEIEFSCTAHDFWRFNVFMIVVGYNQAGDRISFEDFSERIYELEYGDVRTSPPGYNNNRTARITTGECAYAEVYVYAVANTLPASEVIKDTPSFPARLRVAANNEEVFNKEYTVNPWGGLTIVAQRVNMSELPKK